LDLVSDLDVPVVYVSTAYVAGRRHGLVLEGELDRGQSFSNAYERSKFEAECLFQLGVGTGLRGTIVRPSIVVGRRRDGVTRDFKNIYVMLRLVTSGRMTRVPGRPDATLDLVPVDDVVDVVAAASRGLAGWTGKVLHAVGGPVTLADISRTVAEYPSLALPEYVPPANFLPSSLPSVQRALYERYVRLYEPYLTARTRFDDSNAQRTCPQTRLRALHLSGLNKHSVQDAVVWRSAVIKILWLLRLNGDPLPGFPRGHCCAACSTTAWPW